MFKRGSKISCGLDIGSDAIKWASVDVESARILELQSAELMSGRSSRADDLEITDDGPRSLTTRLRDVLADFSRSAAQWSRSVTTAIAARETNCGYVELPALNAKELEVAVPARVAALIPFALDDVQLSYVPVAPLDPAVKGSAVIYAAVLKKVLDPYTQALKSSGLDIRRVEVAPIALARELAFNRPAEKDRLLGIVHVGFRWTHFIVARAGNPYYSRQIPLGGRDFTYAFQQGSQQTWQDSEQAKRSHQAYAHEHEPAIEPFLVRWMDEIKRSLADFRKRHPRAPEGPARLYLSGGSALWRGLEARLAEHLQLMVLLDKWEALSASPAAVRAGSPLLFKTAVGLALTP
jgi:type IV pilus assembly protein PilM